MHKKDKFSQKVLKSTELHCSKLLEVCSKEFPQNNRKSQEELYKELYQIVQELIVTQKEYAIVPKTMGVISNRRQECLANLMQQYQTIANINYKLTFQENENQGSGLFAQEFIEAGSVIMEVPASHCLSSATVLKSKISSFIGSSPLTSSMPNVSLALFLLHELTMGDDSEWSCYIRALPSNSGLILNVTPDDLAVIKGTSAFEKVIQDYRNICRQYCLLHRMINGQKNNKNSASTLAFINTFCFEDYKWAVGMVMSRNNVLPSNHENNSKRRDDQLAMIPLLDMVNHKLGEFSLDFDDEKQKFVLYAMENSASGSQIFMHYGNRTDLQFLLYSGFVPVENPHNSVFVPLFLNRRDSLYEKKADLLDKLGLNRPNSYHLEDNDVVPLTFLAFARLFTLSGDSFNAVEKLLLDDLKIILFSSQDFIALGFSEVEKNALTFLQGRFLLLERSIGVDFSVDDLGSLNDLQRLVEKEKRIYRRKKEAVEVCLKQLC